MYGVSRLIPGMERSLPSCQRKDGRYAYKYTDAYGKPQFVYSWRLVATDKTPAGKRDDLPLWEKVKEIQRDIDAGIDPVGKKMTDCQLYAKRTAIGRMSSGAPRRVTPTRPSTTGNGS